MSLLSDSESSGDEKKVVERLKINEKFADRFERSERVKDLHRAKELLKNADADDDEESDSESETEDEDAEQLSLGLDLKIIQTINSLRKKDPKIYDPNAKWFDQPEESSSDEEGEPKKGDSKKKKYKDILREQLLESEAAGGLGDGDGIETATRGVRDTASRNTLVYDAEQEKIRQAFIKSAGKAVEDSSDSDGQDGVLRVKRKSAQETKAEELELQRALKEMRELAAKTAKAEESKKGKDKNKTVLLEDDVEEGFLENYLEKQLWKEKDSTQRRRKDAEEESEEENLDEDEAELDQVDRFESKYNFRFEEMQDEKNRLGEGGAVVEVTGHARNVQGSMRREDDKRKTQRESRKERKEKEKRQQEAELRRLKNLKRQEVSCNLGIC
jgi:protein KRI1